MLFSSLWFNDNLLRSDSSFDVPKRKRLAGWKQFSSEKLINIEMGYLWSQFRNSFSIEMLWGSSSYRRYPIYWFPFLIHLFYSHFLLRCFYSHFSCKILKWFNVQMFKRKVTWTNVNKENYFKSISPNRSLFEVALSLKGCS